MNDSQELTSWRWKLRKLFRFMQIYGPHRALVKATGRMRLPLLMGRRSNLKSTGVAFVGCGQFAFSTLAYFLRKHARFVACFDIDDAASRTMAKTWGVLHIHGTFADVLNDRNVELAYIASNHSSHSSYAVELMRSGKDVYIEKPIATNRAQLQALCETAASSGRKVFAGYNRPFAPALLHLRRYLQRPRGPMTLSCFISAHVLDSAHWYRKPDEGTRICGNVGHWLDLAVHLLNWRHLPDALSISIAYGDSGAPDDNIAISLTSDYGDLLSIVISSRCEPFEGISEAIHFQWDGVIASINDFRKLTIWHGEVRRVYRYWPKDVGHRSAILQPFQVEVREWGEVTDSTLLMLFITDMVQSLSSSSRFSFSRERAHLWQHGNRSR